MDNLAKLTQIGLKEVAQKTHIELEYLEYIVAKDFEKLLKTNTRGFIKIIERECDVDLSSWIAEFDEFCEQNGGRNYKTTFISPKIPSYKQKEKSHWGLIIFLLIIIIIIALLNYFKVLDFIPKLFDDINKSAIYPTSKNITKAEENLNSLKESNITLSIPQVSFDTNTTLLDENLTKNDKNDTILDDINTTDIQDTQTIENVSKKDEINKIDDNITATHSENIAYIRPKYKLWIGTIDLKTGKKSGFYIKKEYKINLSKNMLILSGHGILTLNFDGKDENFKSKNPLRFLVENGTIKQISLEKFMQLNKGKSW